jgi:uncharacterized membrane protein
MEWNKVVGYAVMLFHAALGILAFFGPYGTNNIKYLLLFLALYLFVLVQWAVLRKCVITRFENFMLEQEATTSTLLAGPIGMIFGENDYILYCMIPFMNGLFCLIKIYGLLTEDETSQSKYIKSNDIYIGSD